MNTLKKNSPIHLLNKIFYKNNQIYTSRIIILFILMISLMLNLWGNSWGQAKNWHPDELVNRTISMAQDKTLNPGHFAYGASHYYVIGAGAVMPAFIISKLFDPAPNKGNKLAYSQWRDRITVRIKVMARSISAIMSCIIILITFYMGKLLFDYKVGLVASLMLTIMPFFVIIAHFATIDPPSNFWYWSACFLSLLGWKKEKTIFFILAFFVGGIAIGTKVDRLIVILPLILSVIFSKSPKKMGAIPTYLSLMIVGYIAVNPTFVLSFFEFLDGITRETFFNMLRGQGADQVGISLTQRVIEGMGIPLCIMALGGVFLAFVHIFSRKKHIEYIWLISSILPYYLLFSSNYVKSWYAPFLFPALAIFASLLFFTCLNAIPSRLVPIYTVALGAVLIYTCSQSVSLILQLVNDSRYLATHWIEEHIPKHNSIELGPRSLLLKEDDYKIIKRQRDPAHYETEMKWRGLMEEYKTYQAAKKTIFSVEDYLVGKFKIKKHEPYLSWFDRAHIQFKNIKDNKKENQNGIAPDYKVLTGIIEKNRIGELNSKTSKYILTKHIKYQSPIQSGLGFSFVNPDVYIYKHVSIAN